jgi:DNA-binding XRE family transcriptional regulator
MRSTQPSFRETGYTPFTATQTLPASEERIQTYRCRAQAHQALFREDDLSEDEHRGLPGLPNGPNGKRIPVPRTENRESVTDVTGPKDFCSVLRVLRRRVGLSQRGLAELMGVHLDTIRFYEYGIREPTYSMIRALAQALHCSVILFFPPQG